MDTGHKPNSKRLASARRSILIETRRSELERLLQECKSFAQVTSRFRQIIEEDAGLKNFEIPMSRLANGTAFAEFVFRCVNDGERLLDVYNSSRDDFRDERGISNPGQPVPALRRVGDWIETPFWIYHTTETSHRSVLIRITGKPHGYG